MTRSTASRPLILLCSLSLLLLAASSNRASAESAKRREVRNLLQLTGADKLGAQVMQQLIVNFQRSFQNVPAAYWKKLARRLDTKELVEQIIPVYEKHFSRKDLQGLIAFYKSPLGRKFISKQPQLVAESMQIGQNWGQKMAQRVARELQQMKKK